MLTDIEMAALERRRQWRTKYTEESGFTLDGVDTNILADAMLRLHQPGHDAEITPESLVGSGATLMYGQFVWEGAGIQIKKGGKR